MAAVTESFAGAYANADETLAWTLAWPDYGETFAKLDAATKKRFIDHARSAIAETGDLTWRFAVNLHSARCSEEEHAPTQSV